MLKINRRTLLKTLTAAIVLLKIRETVALDNTIQPSPEDAAPDAAGAMSWMNYLENTKSINSPFKIQKFPDNMYAVIQPLDWQPNVDQTALQPVTVPYGFVTDFASIPRIFWSLLSPDDDYAYAAVIHDYLYWNQAQSKHDADLILKHAMQDLDVSPTKTFLIFTAVDKFGQSAWDENKRLKEKGERRILKSLPSNAATKWSEWKNKDVY